MLFLLAGLTTAGTLDGWENSRWLVEIEQTLPVQFRIAGPDANPPVMRAFQIQAQLICPEFKMSGKKAAYINCTAEKLAMRATPQANPGPRLDEYKAAFEALNKALTDGKYEMKLKQDGKVSAVDFYEPAKTDPIVVEAARALAIDLLSGFSLTHEDVPEGSPWDEINSNLMRAPTQPLGNGKTKIRHQPIDNEGEPWLQSTGNGTFTSQYMSWGAGRAEQIRGAAAAGGEYGARGQGTMMVTKTFKATFNSFAHLGDGTGPFVERVWNVNSIPNHDMTDMTGTQGTPLWSAGHIRRLSDGEAPELRPSGLISAPGAMFEGLPAWEPMPTIGG